MHDLHESDILDLTSDVHKEALWFCFADLLQADLDKVRDYWNSHMIRKSRHAIVSGVPDMMYFLPEEFDRNDCLFPVSPLKLQELVNRLEVLGEDDETEADPVYEEYFHYVMGQNNLLHPTTIYEAGVLFQQLVRFAMPA